MKQIVRRPESGPLARPSDARVRHYVEQGRSPNTMRAYRSDAKRFVAWCTEQGLPSMPAPADVIAAYLAHLADLGKAASTIARALAAIAKAHELSGHSSPTKEPLVRATMAGIRRVIGTAPKPVKALMLDELRKMIDSITPDVRGDRDRAMILVGYTAALRRSEVVALQIQHLVFSEKGLLILIPRSKADQEAAGQHVAVPFANDERYCAVRALKHWLARAKLDEEKVGTVFRKVFDNKIVDDKMMSPQTVKDIVKRWAEKAGLDPKRVAGHSLRAGFATSAAVAGANHFEIQTVTRHKTLTSLQRYIRFEDLFAHSPTKGLL